MPIQSTWSWPTNNHGTRFQAAVWAIGALCIVGLVIWLSNLGGPVTSTAPPSSAITSVSPVTTARRDPRDFVGNQVCSECHAEIAAHYRRNPMSHSWIDVTSSVPDDLTQPGTVSDVDKDYVYHAQFDQGRLVQQETLATKNGHRLTAIATYAVGSGNHARALVSAQNGYLTQLPLGWFPHEDTWKLNPGYELKNHRFDRPVVAGCLACHGAFAIQDTPARNHFQRPVTDGIRCEQCHGPGRQHVVFHERNRDLKSATTADPIVHPGRLSQRQANDVCLQCHLQGDVAVYREGADAFSFCPGDHLTDHRLDFLIDTATTATFGVASHGARLIRSRCYSASGGQLTCFQCHDPHRPTSDFSASVYDAKCVACHTPESCERDLGTVEVRDENGCVQCHMPRRQTREGQHLVFTDHWIQKPSTQPSQASAPPVLPPNSDVTLISLRPEVDPQSAYLGMAYVELHTAMGPQFPALTRGMDLLKAAHADNPADRLVRYWLASGQVAQQQSPAAINHLRALLKEQPDWHEARFRLAVAYHQMNRSSEAITEYERIIEAVPEWMEPYPLAVRLHLLKKDSASAERLLDQQISYCPDAVAFLNLALARQMSGRSLQDYLPLIDDSLALDPLNVTAYLTRAYLFAMAEQRPDAIRDYRKALQIDPGNRDAIAGLRAVDKPE